MKKGFYTVMAAQFFSSLADNALLIAAIALLVQVDAPEWMTPLLKLFFVLSYVVLAAFVGAFADAFPKGKVMLITNGIKVLGCLMMLLGSHPLLAYGVVGFGAAAYSPAKYGILTELLPAEKLVAANGWIEGLTVSSIILGTALGGILISTHVSDFLLELKLFTTLGIDTAADAAMLVIIVFYLLAAVFNLRIPLTGAVYERQAHNPVHLVRDFAHCFTTLWKDRLGQISLAVTTLFWGAGATLQFIVLKWAEECLDMSLSRGAVLQAVVAVGVALGAVLAAMRVPLKRSLSVLPAGLVMGFVVMLMAFFSKDAFPDYVFHIGRFHVPLYLLLAYVFLMFIGGLAGYFVVPMNALLQHRGHVLLSAGHSIAVQNFNENLSILVMLCMYALLVRFDVSIEAIVIMFGVFVCGTMYLTMRRHAANQKEFDSLHLIGEPKRNSPH